MFPGARLTIDARGHQHSRHRSAFPLAIGPTSSVKQRASNPGFVWWESPCLIRAPLIWLTSLITSTVGGQGGQVESSKYRHLSQRIPSNSALLLINRAGPLSPQICIKMHDGREVNNGIKGVQDYCSLSDTYKELERWSGSCAYTVHER